MHKKTAIGVALAISALLAACSSRPPCAARGDSKPAVATVRLAEDEMTPVEMVLSRDIPAGTELRLRQESRLRPVWVGIFQITNITAQGVEEPLALRGVPTFEDIKGKWGQYEQSGAMAVLKAATNLAAGTRLTIRGCRYNGIDRVRQRYTGRETRAWLEAAGTNTGPACSVSEPLIVRMGGGPVHYLEAYRKADGRLAIQAFDKEDNPTDDAGLIYTVAGDTGKPLVVRAAPGCEVTEILLPSALRDSAALTVADSAQRQCRSSALPRGLDGRSICFGDLHCHTGFSDGDFPAEDTVAWARTRMALDFTGPGDHISQEGNFGDLTYVDYARFGRGFEQPGVFCRLPALETSCGGGHQLVCARSFPTFIRFMADYVKHVGPKADTMDSAAFYTALARIMPPGKALVLPAHPIGHPDRWPDIPDKSCVRAAEIFHGGSSHEFHVADTNWLAGGGREESSIRHALDTGYRLGFIGDSDNHRCLPGMSMIGRHGMTAVQVEHLDTASLFDAIYRGRCYATSGARIVADATLNDGPIGSTILVGPTEARNFNIVVRGTAPIAETQIIHGGNVLKTFPAASNAWDVNLEWTDIPPAGRKVGKVEYYYVRVRQTDGEAAWLSPFWVKNP